MSQYKLTKRLVAISNKNIKNNKSFSQKQKKNFSYNAIKKKNK